LDTKKTVFIIDDDLDLQKITASNLSALGFTVSTASSGRDALKILEKKPFDITISDIRMPDLNGLALLNAIKIKNIQTRFIFMTASTEITNAQDAIKLGACGYVEKPAHIDRVLEEIEKALAISDDEILRRLRVI
jgi:DNA-binding NtrC family response regulator